MKAPYFSLVFVKYDKQIQKEKGYEEDFFRIGFNGGNRHIMLRVRRVLRSKEWRA